MDQDRFPLFPLSVENRSPVGGAGCPWFPRSLPSPFSSVLPRRFADRTTASGAHGWVIGPSRSPGAVSGTPGSCWCWRLPQVRVRGEARAAPAPRRGAAISPWALAAAGGRRHAPPSDRSCVRAATTGSTGRDRSASGSAQGAIEGGWSSRRTQTFGSVRCCAQSVGSGRRPGLRSPSPWPPLRCQEPDRCGSGSRCSRLPWSGP